MKAIPLADLIGNALRQRIAAGKGSFHSPGVFKKRISKRDKTRAFWAKNPDVTPWPLRPRLANKHTIERRKK